MITMRSPDLRRLRRVLARGRKIVLDAAEEVQKEEARKVERTLERSTRRAGWTDDFQGRDLTRFKTNTKRTSKTSEVTVSPENRGGAALFEGGSRLRRGRGRMPAKPAIEPVAKSTERNTRGTSRKIARKADKRIQSNFNRVGL